MASEKQSHDATIEAPDRYSVFTTVEKWCIVAMVSYAAWFSTLSSFIYYPALDSISRALSVSVNKVNLTVTSYLAVATIAPTLVGDTADVLGRRPVYLIVLILYFVADVAIALSQDYSALLGLRVLQAAAISGMHFRRALVFFWLLTGSRDLLHRLWGPHRCLFPGREGLIRKCRVICVGSKHRATGMPHADRQKA